MNREETEEKFSTYDVVIQDFSEENALFILKLCKKMPLILTF
jgi:hypothetical protein